MVVVVATVLRVLIIGVLRVRVGDDLFYVLIFDAWQMNAGENLKNKFPQLFFLRHFTTKKRRGVAAAEL